MPKIEPTEEQSEAIEAIKEWFKHFAPNCITVTAGKVAVDGQEFLLDGGAGTGKTTIAALAAEAVSDKHVVYGAYTAKAARVMQSKGMEGASTLHSLIYRAQTDKNGRLVGWTRDGVNSPCTKADLIVVDEVSMVSDDLADDLRSFEKPILVLGDVGGQLPPIEGTGAFARQRPDFTLREVHRTVAGSPILRLAWQARRAGRLTPGGPPEARVAPLNADAWPIILNRDFQVICGKNTTRRTVTRRAREAFGFSGPLPCPGEPLLCCRNNYDQGLINGDIAVLWRITENAPDDDYFTADLLIEGETRTGVRISKGYFISETITRTHTDNVYRGREALFDYAYAITAHKAQGSEWANVVVIDDQFAQWDKDLRRRWLYTAITRARESVTVFQTG